jgi:D-alanine-D-alanine ligase
MENKMQHKMSLIFGGTSAERDLSLRTFHSVYSELQKIKTDRNLYLHIYYINEAGLVIKKAVNFDKGPDYYITSKGKLLTIAETINEIEKNDEFIFSLLYGLYGEDGHYQGIAKTLNIKSSFGSVLSCSLSKSKFHFSKYIESRYPELEPIPCIAIRPQDVDSLEEKLAPFYNQELVIKPNSLGTSMFTERVFLNDGAINTIEKLILEILKYDEIALVQKYISGEEYSCGCIENSDSVEVLPLILVRTKDGFFGRKEKLSKIGVSERIIPTQYNSYTEIMASTSKRIFSDLMFENMCRFDFIVSNGRVYFLEANSLPGLSSASFFPKMLNEINMNISDLIKLTYQNSLKKCPRETHINHLTCLGGAA